MVDEPESPGDETGVAPPATDPVRPLSAALSSLDDLVGPRLDHAVLVEYADRLGTRLSRGALAELRRQNAARLPAWTTVRSFVRACLAYADDRSVVIPPPLRDLGRWRRLYDQSRGPRASGAKNVIHGAVPGTVVQARDIHGDVHVHSAAPSAGQSRCSDMFMQVRRGMRGGEGPSTGCGVAVTLSWS